LPAQIGTRLPPALMNAAAVCFSGTAPVRNWARCTARWRCAGRPWRQSP